MPRTQSRTPDRERVLVPVRRLCPACGRAMRIRYENCRTLVTLAGTVRFRLKIRRCEAADCARFHKPYRPEAEGALALPQHEFGLDVVALVAVEGRRWSIEDAFETAKTELGLAHNETRSQAEAGIGTSAW